MQDDVKKDEEGNDDEGPQGQRRVYRKLPKPVHEMSEEELDAFAEELLRALGSTKGTSPEENGEE